MSLRRAGRLKLAEPGPELTQTRRAAALTVCACGRVVDPCSRAGRCLSCDEFLADLRSDYTRGELDG